MLNEQTILEKVRNYVGPRNGQFNQDVFALAVNDFKRDGYFVEFGALTGTNDSNTLVLERDYGWKGLLCEPATGFQQQLKASRTVNIDFRAVYNVTGATMMFKEMTQFTGLSGLENHNYEDMHANLRRTSSAKEYTVETVTLNDLLEQHNAPSQIDYMSIDTEGSEPAILEVFDFSKHQITFLTIEHNHNALHKQKVRDILTSNGYAVILEEYSGIDDYFTYIGL